MGLRAELANAVGIIFAALDDIPETITYTQVMLSGLNMAKDSPNASYSSVPDVQALFYNASQLEDLGIWRLTSAQNKSSVSDEMFCLIAASSLPTITPRLIDFIEHGDDKYEIYGMVPVPTDPCYILKVRKV